MVEIFFVTTSLFMILVMVYFSEHHERRVNVENQKCTNFKKPFYVKNFRAAKRNFLFMHRRHREKLIAHGISIIDQCFQKKCYFSKSHFFVDFR